MKILMTGATGFIGSLVASAFHEAGYELRLLVRETSDLGALSGIPFERAVGDILDPATLADALAGIDALVHMAGCTSFLPADRERVHTINVDGTRTVLQAALDAGVRRVLYTSSTSAVGALDQPGAPLTEEAAWNATWANYYVQSKWQAEQVAWEIAASGLDLIMVNPSIVWGPGDRNQSSTSIPLGFVKGELPGYIEGGASYVDVRDVAHGHLRAFERGLPGRRYILAGSNLQNADMVKLLARLAGRRAQPRIPYPIAIALAFANELFVLPFKPERGDFSVKVVQTGARYWYADGSLAERDLGVTYRGLEETARDMLRWALTHGQLEAESPELRTLAED